VFVDLSNIFIGAQEAAAAHEEPMAGIRLKVDQLRVLLADGRPIARACVVANAVVPHDVASRFEREFAEWIPREAGSLTGTEQANDETLQVRMYEAIHQLPPGVLVLATGDGSGWQYCRGFVVAIDVAYREGWGVEVASWSHVAHSTLREWTRTHAGAFIDLDDYYYGITFVEHGRRTQPIATGYRPDADRAVRPERRPA
jgi:hypothetical protein